MGMRPLPREVNAETARLFNLEQMLRYRQSLKDNVKLFEDHLSDERKKLEACEDAISVLEGTGVGTN